MKLSETQKRALARFDDYLWHSAYDVQVGLNTLNALVDKGFLEKKHGLGGIAFPRNGIKFRKKQELEE